MLLEREAELTRIDETLDSACADAGVLLAIEGEAGIGKSAVIAAARERAAARGMAVLSARGTELEIDYPFGAVRQWLEPAVRRDEHGLFDGAASLAAPVVIDVPAQSVGVSAGALHGLYWLLSNLCERGPLLLTVDDAHWLDEPSLRFVAYLATRIDSLPAALVIATRPVGDGILQQVLTEPMALTGLREPAVSEYLNALTGYEVDAAFAGACHRATGGNPFLLTELARKLQEDDVPFTAASAPRIEEIAPPQVTRSTRARLARLDPAAGALARAVAVLGDDAPLDVACELAQLELPVGARMADALVTAGLLESSGELRFRHPLLRSAIASGVTPFERSALHARAASLLRSRGASVERVAIHVLATTVGQDPNGARTLQAAADRAVERGAPDAAIRLLDRLLEEPLDPDARASTLTELGRLEYVIGRVNRGVEHLRAAYANAADPVTQARALIPLAQASTRSRLEAQELVASNAELIEAVRAADPELALRLANLRGGSPEAIEHARALKGDNAGEAAVLGYTVFEAIDAGATAAEVAELAERAALQVEALVEDGTTTTAFAGTILGLRWADRVDSAERALARAIGSARRQGSVLGFANAMGLRASVRIRTGRLRDAEADARSALAVGLDAPTRFFIGGVQALLECLAARGRAEEAEATLRHEIAGAELPDVPPVIALILAQAYVRAAGGDHLGALAQFDEAWRRRERYGPGPTPSWIGDLLRAAECQRLTGHDEVAAALVAQAHDLAQRWGTPGHLGQTLRGRALLDADGDAVELLRESVALLEQSPARLEHARALVDLGAALRRASFRAASREPLKTGYDLARQCGADGLAETARQELAASGVRVRRERLSGIESLTPSERRIAEMAADGTSNAEIAQALFVTRKTVEMHLTNAYRKLDISGRRGLTTILSARAPA